MGRGLYAGRDRRVRQSLASSSVARTSRMRLVPSQTADQGGWSHGARAELRAGDVAPVQWDLKDLGFGDRARAGAADQQAAEQLDAEGPARQKGLAECRVERARAAKQLGAALGAKTRPAGSATPASRRRGRGSGARRHEARP